MTKRAICLALAIAALYLAFLGSHSLIEPDEGRYAEIPREMMESGDYIVPRLNGVKYFEKPPMTYWMTAACFALLGEGELAARAPSAISALLAIAAAAAAAAAIYGRRAGAISAAVAATSLLFFGVGRIALTDMPLTLFITAALAAYLMADVSSSPRSRRALICASYACMALGVLTKGLVAIVLPGGVVLIYALALRSLRPIVTALSPLGMAVFFVIAVPYFWIVCTEAPEFFDFFFIREHFLRYTTQIHSRYEPFWFFFAILPAGMMPWTPWLAALASRGSIVREPASDRVRRANIFLIAWSLVILFFFSLSSSKLIPYVVPCVPPLAMLIGANFSRMIERGRVSRGGMTACVALCLLLAAALVWYAATGRQAAELGLVPTAAASAAALTIGAIASAVCAIRGRTSHSVYALCAGAALFLFALTPLWGVMGETRGMKAVSDELMSNASGRAIAEWDDILQGVPFYTHRLVTVVGGAGELDFGFEREAIERPDAPSRLLSYDDFRDAWRSGAPYALVIKTDRLQEAALEARRRVDIGRYSVLYN